MDPQAARISEALSVTMPTTFAFVSRSISAIVSRVRAETFAASKEDESSRIDVHKKGPGAHTTKFTIRSDRVLVQESNESETTSAAPIFVFMATTA
jgi:hypothetical protein